MNEIEKLYSLAGVEKELTRTNAGLTYPPFTAEKQIEILNLLGNIKRRMRRQFVFLKLACDTKGWIAMFGNDIEGNVVKSKYKKELYRCLAELIYYTWQDLTEGEQNEIREILE